MNDRDKTKEQLLQELAELRQRVDALSQTAKELERSNKDLTQSADILSHDLHEPLRTTCSFLQLLKNRYQGKLDREADELIDHALRGSRRMSRMIQDLTSLSRVQMRGQPRGRTDCESALGQATGNLLAAIEESGAVITHDPLPRVRADRAQLVQLLQNLIGNALKFRGSSAPRVHVSAKQVNGHFIFSVRDNGIGIDPAQSDRIFCIFERLHGPDTYPGTGIGLALCKRVVERHGGKIWVDSVPGHGSVFYFTLSNQNGSGDQP